VERNVGTDAASCQEGTRTRSLIAPRDGETMDRKLVGRFLILSLMGVVLGLFMRRMTLPMGFGQAEIYTAMAGDPWGLHAPPEGYRIAVPMSAAALSSVLHLKLVTAFFLLQIGLYGAIVATLFSWCVGALGLDTFVAAILCALYAFSYGGIYNLHNVAHVGFAEHLFILLACMAIHARRFTRLAVVLLLSCFVKETIAMVILPTTFVVVGLTSRWREAVLRTVPLVAAVVLTTLFLRSGFIFTHKVAGAGTGTGMTLEYLHYTWHEVGGWRGGLSAVLHTYGPLWLLAGIGFWHATRSLRALFSLQLFSALMLFIAYDAYRMVSLGEFVVLALTGVALSRAGKPRAAIAALASVLFSLCFNRRIAYNLSLIGSSLAVLAVMLGPRFTGLSRARA
jgi:hypothetical protein